MFLGQARKSLWIETPNLSTISFTFNGQARKSLWIETVKRIGESFGTKGQARKSLWIETLNYSLTMAELWVRLVRACGSKLG